MNRIQKVEIKGTTGSFSITEAQVKATTKLVNTKRDEQKDILSGLFKKLEVGNLAIVKDMKLVSLIHDILNEKQVDEFISLLKMIVR